MVMCRLAGVVLRGGQRHEEHVVESNGQIIEIRDTTGTAYAFGFQGGYSGTRVDFTGTDYEEGEWGPESCVPVPYIPFNLGNNACGIPCNLLNNLTCISTPTLKRITGNCEHDSGAILFYNTLSITTFAIKLPGDCGTECGVGGPGNPPVPGLPFDLPFANIGPTLEELM